MLPSKKTLVDLAERSIATFAQAFAAALTLGSVTDLRAVELAAVAGSYAVLKFTLAKANAFLNTAPPDPPKPSA